MDIDFTALASRVAARAEVLGCVILSRDGLVMGAFPPNGERDVTPAWLRFASVGDPERGFVEFEGELWAYVRRGPYAAFAVGTSGSRAGILLDYLEQALMAAEDSRDQRAAVRTPEHVDLNREHFGSIRPAERPAVYAPSPATAAREASPHPSGPLFEPIPPVLQEATPAGGGEDWAAPNGTADHETGGPSPADRGAESGAGAKPATLPDATPPYPFPPTTEDEPEDPSDPSSPLTNPEDIDRVALAREFAQLLQDGPFGVEEGR